MSATPTSIQAASFVAVLSLTGTALAEGSVSTSIITEAINDYDPCFGPGQDLDWSLDDSWAFRVGMSASGSSFTLGPDWIEGNVWVSDFVESSDSGTDSFDAQNRAISYFVGHGSCDTGDTSQFCWTASNCTSPPSGTFAPAMCRRLPGDNFGTCSYTRFAREITTCDTGAANPGVIYSNGVRWGESTWSGSWGGAGTDGGTNLIIVHASCAEMSGRGQEVWDALRGAHLLGTTMVHSGDVGNSWERGDHFSSYYRANPLSSVSQGWMNTSNDESDRNDFCRSASGTPFGGGFGINGCGGHVMSSVGWTSAQANGLINENWNQVRGNGNDAFGDAFWASRWICNYDCNTWSFGI